MELLRVSVFIFSTLNMGGDGGWSPPVNTIFKPPPLKQKHFGANSNVLAFPMLKSFGFPPPPILSSINKHWRVYLSISLKVWSLMTCSPQGMFEFVFHEHFIWSLSYVVRLVQKDAWYSGDAHSGSLTNSVAPCQKYKISTFPEV